MDAFALSWIFLRDIEQVNVMIIAHVRRGDVLAIGREAEGGDRAAPLGQRHHLDSFGRLCVPNEDHGLEANLSRGNTRTVCADS